MFFRFCHSCVQKEERSPSGHSHNILKFCSCFQWLYTNLKLTNFWIHFPYLKGKQTKGKEDALDHRSVGDIAQVWRKNSQKTVECLWSTLVAKTGEVKALKGFQFQLAVVQGQMHGFSQAIKREGIKVFIWKHSVNSTFGIRIQAMESGGWQQHSKKKVVKWFKLWYMVVFGQRCGFTDLWKRMNENCMKIFMIFQLGSRG